MVIDDKWATDYLKALRVRADMIEAYGSVGAWMDNSEEYERRMTAADTPKLEETDSIIDRIKRLVGK